MRVYKTVHFHPTRSETGFFASKNSEFCEAIELKIAALDGIPNQNAAPLSGQLTDTDHVVIMQVVPHDFPP